MLESNCRYDQPGFSIDIQHMLRKNPGGSIRKTCQLMDHVCCVYQALFFLTESAKNHMLNTSGFGSIILVYMRITVGTATVDISFLVPSVVGLRGSC